MLTGRTCTALTKGGDSCRQPPLRDADRCFWHSPDHVEEAAEARRLGGLRRRREGAVAGAYEVDGLNHVGGIRRVIEIVTLDALGMENSIARGRLLIAAMLAATKLLEVSDLAARVERMEAALTFKREQEGSY